MSPFPLIFPIRWMKILNSFCGEIKHLKYFIFYSSICIFCVNWQLPRNVDNICPLKNWNIGHFLKTEKTF